LSNVAARSSKIADFAPIIASKCPTVSNSFSHEGSRNTQHVLIVCSHRKKSILRLASATGDEGTSIGAQLLVEFF
jgi:hypothetical protein